MFSSSSFFHIDLQMAHSFTVDGPTGADHPLKVVHGEASIWKLCATGCGAAWNLTDSLIYKVAEPGVSMSMTCSAAEATIRLTSKFRAPQPAASPSLPPASAAPDPKSAVLSNQQVAAALKALKMPSPSALDLEVKEPIRAIGDPGLLGNEVEDRRKAKYNSTAAWADCAKMAERRQTVLLAAIWVKQAAALIRSSQADTVPALEGATDGAVGDGTAEAGDGGMDVDSGTTSGDGAGCSAGPAEAPASAGISVSVLSSGHTVSGVCDMVVSVPVSTFQVLEACLVDSLFKQGSELFVRHLSLVASRYAFPLSQATVLQPAAGGGNTRVSWFWPWMDARCRVATDRCLGASGVMRMYAVSELVGSLIFEPSMLIDSFSWPLWLARLGLAYAVRDVPAHAPLLPLMWSSVNAFYVASERECNKHNRGSVSAAAHAASAAVAAAKFKPVHDQAKNATKRDRTPSVAASEPAFRVGTASPKGAARNQKRKAQRQSAKAQPRALCDKCNLWHAVGAPCRHA